MRCQSAERIAMAIVFVLPEGIVFGDQHPHSFRIYLGGGGLSAKHDARRAAGCPPFSFAS